MSGDVHVRFCERLGVRLPRATHLVVGFEHREEAERFLAALRERFARFGLTLHPDKTRLIEFGRHADRTRRARGHGKPATFNFLGAGGIGSGRQIAASLALGAQGVWTGSIWLGTEEYRNLATNEGVLQLLGYAE